MSELSDKAIHLLQKLVSTPSLSREESDSADIIGQFLEQEVLAYDRINHNILAKYDGADPEAPYILLCSHHDTVKPNPGYTRDPYDAGIEGGRLYGLGSNDAGASLVSMIATYRYFAQGKYPFNLLLAAVAEEEISGPNGVSRILPHLPPIDLAIVGEPTSLQVAIAEKGLLVIDALTTGVPGHAAHENTVNPILQASKDIEAIYDLQFDRISPYLGKTKSSVTVINAGQAHNQVPAECKFVIDVRVNECYSLEEVVNLLQDQVQSTLTPRSTRLKPSSLPPTHKMHTIAERLGLKTYGSPTLSDQALLPFNSIKIGPGDSTRSHSADEFVEIQEILDGIDTYIALIKACSEI